MHAFPLFNTGASSLNIIDMILNSRGMVLIDLLVLIAFSFITWYIIVFKSIRFIKSGKSNTLFLEMFWGGSSLDQIYKKSGELADGTISKVYIAGYKELAKLESGNQPSEDKGHKLQNLERSLKKAAMGEIMEMESKMPVLATIAATAPFLGLFGTVWGIMVSFSAIGLKGNTSLATVAPGIVDALVTTALGLIAAIPATIAYNYFQRKIRLQIADMETFANDFLNIAQRKFLS
ncbi:MotA/TolQ/ExbB proton channel family protein [Myxococcota bacterium]|nr:MotA/TolQ/ExbB proton channel family protein [Myxococcota bacterium]MBU1537350.1 MotA/TolQ/ExbB proton channel family protein [Myxococcota bacterium]